jgi:hypothetical protein
MRRISAAVILLCAGAVLMVATCAGAQLFLPSVQYATENQPTGTAVGDVNGDSHADAVVMAYAAGCATVHLGNGDGTFQPAVVCTTGAGSYGIALALLDSDAHLDMAIARTDGYLVVLLGNGDGTFQAQTEYAAGSGSTALSAADLDGDGDQDIVVTNLSSANVSVFLGNGDGTFESAVNYASNGKPRYVALADLNEDLVPDIAVPNENYSAMSVLLGNGDGTFGAYASYSCGYMALSIAASDLDYDGHLDLAVAERHMDHVYIYWGIGDGTFPSFSVLPAADGPQFVGAYDMDGDGKSDLVTANGYSNDVSFFRGNGDGTFEPHVDYAAEAEPFHVAIGDLDNDIDRDLVVVCQSADSISVLLNTSGHPVVPTIVRIDDVPNDQGRQVRVEWLRSRYDSVGDSVCVTGYGLYRREDGYRSTAGAANDPAASSNERDRLEGWDYISTIPAHTDSFYQCVAPTLCDSTLAHGYCPSTFLVRATTSSPSMYFDSEPAVGYSVDNLAPGVPAGLAVAYHEPGGNDLSWHECEDEDFQYFKIYRGDSEEFEPGPENLIHMTTAIQWTDGEGTGWDHYKVSAVDHAGNESPVASPEMVTGIEDAVPKAYSSSHNFPNPFSPTTHIWFDVPNPGAAINLRVYDSAGRAVRTLLNSWMPPGSYTEVWDGRDEEGSELATGVYFYVLEAPGFTERRKMVLVR